MTNAQLIALKAAILADPNLTAQVSAGATGAIAEYLRGASTFIVWRSSTAAQDIYNAITWANLTPTDVPDSTAVWTNRSLACQGKQFNVQTLLQGRDRISSDKPNVRAGLQDGLTNVPSGAAGATVSAGWTTVRLAMQRPASVFEKIFATGAGTQATPGSLVLEGGPQDYDVVQALTQV